MPLIDIAGDQYGNYLIQWILMNAAPHQRELVASHIRCRGNMEGDLVAETNGTLHTHHFAEADQMRLEEGHM
ncbi:hypothetical protein EYZ11_006141 [Aspergillus tanneri]|uniref:PUM-HD domain-containing protein n=1 Tax=Aspergillus tanneri TaxID=1220188 RepID=A0A4S3JGM3_9EURO|nr:hypothetical protein EYZ11_006141 [Aspergillus tanneri]